MASSNNLPSEFTFTVHCTQIYNESNAQIFLFVSLIIVNVLIMQSLSDELFNESFIRHLDSTLLHCDVFVTSLGILTSFLSPFFLSSKYEAVSSANWNNEKSLSRAFISIAFFFSSNMFTKNCSLTFWFLTFQLSAAKYTWMCPSSTLQQ